MIVYHVLHFTRAGLSLNINTYSVRKQQKKEKKKKKVDIIPCIE